MSWWIVKGGPVMIPILLGSVLGLAVAIERLLTHFKVSFEKSRQCVREIFQELEAGRVSQALSIVRENRQPVASVLRAGLEQWGMPSEVMKEAMEEANQRQVEHLEHWLGALASIITVEPMLGFLGTITGLIQAFMAWEAAGAEVTVSTLASGIYEAMITTAAGLIIAIPLLMAYNSFVSRTKHVAAFSAQAAHRLDMLYARSQTKEIPHEASLRP